MACEFGDCNSAGEGAGGKGGDEGVGGKLEAAFLGVCCWGGVVLVNNTVYV